MKARKFALFLDRYGSLLLWAIFFVAGAIVKGVALHDGRVWSDLPPDACLWAIGMLVSEILSERERLGGRLAPLITSETTGYNIKYGVALSGDPRESSAPLYLMLGGVGLWIVALVLCGRAQATIDAAGKGDTTAVALIVLSYVLAVLVVLGALWGTIWRYAPTTNTGAATPVPATPAVTVRVEPQAAGQAPQGGA